MENLDTDIAELESFIDSFVLDENENPPANDDGNDQNDENSDLNETMKKFEKSFEDTKIEQETTETAEIRHDDIDDEIMRNSNQTSTSALSAGHNLNNLNPYITADIARQSSTNSHIDAQTYNVNNGEFLTDNGPINSTDNVENWWHTVNMAGNDDHSSQRNYYDSGRNYQNMTTGRAWPVAMQVGAGNQKLGMLSPVSHSSNNSDIDRATSLQSFTANRNNHDSGSSYSPNSSLINSEISPLKKKVSFGATKINEFSKPQKGGRGGKNNQNSNSNNNYNRQKVQNQTNLNKSNSTGNLNSNQTKNSTNSSSTTKNNNRKTIAKHVVSDIKTHLANNKNFNQNILLSDQNANASDNVNKTVTDDKSSNPDAGSNIETTSVTSSEASSSNLLSGTNLNDPSIVAATFITRLRNSLPNLKN